MKSVSIEDFVIYVDSKGREHNALVTSVNGPSDQTPSVNLVYISKDEERNDSWGRQIERDSSVVHESNQSAHGRYWYFV